MVPRPLFYLSHVAAGVSAEDSGIVVEMLKGSTLVPLTVAVTLAASTPALACEISAPDALTVVPNATDVTPPSTPEAQVAKVRVGRADTYPGDCGALTYVVFEVSATDDVTASADLGYLLESEGAKLATGNRPLVADSSGQILVYLDGTLESHGPDIDVRVSAVDTAGNISPAPRVVTVHRTADEDGEAGCQLGSRNKQSGSWIELLAVLLAAAPMRRARRA